MSPCPYMDGEQSARIMEHTDLRAWCRAGDLWLAIEARPRDRHGDPPAGACNAVSARDVEHWGRCDDLGGKDGPGGSCTTIKVGYYQRYWNRPGSAKRATYRYGCRTGK